MGRAIPASKLSILLPVLSASLYLNCFEASSRAIYRCKICGQQYDSWSSRAAHGFCSDWCERSPFLPFPELEEPSARMPPQPWVEQSTAKRVNL
jgi:hypothetical protein